MYGPASRLGISVVRKGFVVCGGHRWYLETLPLDATSKLQAKLMATSGLYRLSQRSSVIDGPTSAPQRTQLFARLARWCVGMASVESADAIHRDAKSNWTVVLARIWTNR